MMSTNAAQSEFNAQVLQSAVSPTNFERDSGYRAIPSSQNSGTYHREERVVQMARPLGQELSAAAALAKVKSIIKTRRIRSRFFSEQLFADPAWDMLLDLTRGQLECQRVSIMSLCGAAHVPATTALRHIATMTAKGMLQRRPDPLDGRREFIELTPTTLDSMLRFLNSIA